MEPGQGKESSSPTPLPEVYDLDDPFPYKKVSVGVARFFVVVEFQMAQPSPRYRHFSAAVVDKLYLWGGIGGRGESVVTSIAL